MSPPKSGGLGKCTLSRCKSPHFLLPSDILKESDANYVKQLIWKTVRQKV